MIGNGCTFMGPQAHLKILLSEEQESKRSYEAGARMKAAAPEWDV